ncbi:hypothetical protein [Thermomonospora amylolytica]|uniref:hypothetical protein n=1 Tax=Thermomonospora amylolytica TaxID=1411117 RepID=UPI000E6BB11F|nr:hypothetical protein [Thermomonospora amylolytica]
MPKKGAEAQSAWALPHAVEARERFLTATPYATPTAVAAERDEQWHAAHLIRRRYRHPKSWLECVGLTHVPADPNGWCNCPAIEDTANEGRAQ